jgi:tetratricopeptide (TPR) repeat protein
MTENFVNLKVDKDKYEQLASKFKVGGIPDTIFVTGEGRIVKRIVGYMPAEDWLKEIRGVPEAWKKLQEAEAAVAKDEKDAAARVELGKLLIGAGDGDGAEKHLKKATELDADNAKGLALEAWWLLADAQMSSDEPNMAKAKEALEKVVALDGKNEKGRRDNADAKLAGMLADSDPKAARTAFEKVVADWPNTDGAFEAMFMIGALMANVDGDLDGAEAQMKKVVEADPNGDWGKRADFAIKQIAKMRKGKKEKK